MGRFKRPPRFAPKSRVNPKQFARKSGLRLDRPAASRVAQELLTGVAMATRKVMGAELIKVMEEADKQWPRRTGRSAAALSLDWKISAFELEGILDDKVDYALEIRGGETVETLLTQPAIQADKIIQKALDKEIAKRAKKV
jgi:hypothetical protein